MPPVVMALGGWTTEMVPNFNGRVYPTKVPLCGRSLPIYQPVDWLIDHTPLNVPLYAWADQPTPLFPVNHYEGRVRS